MKKLFIIASTLAVLGACTNSNTGSGNPEGDGQIPFADTTWELIQEEGYEISGEFREDWQTKSPDFGATYTFRSDHTGTYTTYEHIDGNESSSTNRIRWEYSETETTLVINFTDSGDQRIYQVQDMSSTTLRLVVHTKQPEYAYEYYNVETYTKK